MAAPAPASTVVVRDQAKYTRIEKAGDVHIHSTDRIHHPLSLDNFVSTVPQSRVTHHVERPDLRAKLATQLHDHIDATTSGSLVSVLHGLGGAGKTQVVLDYIEQYQDDYRGIFWIEMGSRQLVEESFRMVYRTIFQLPVLIPGEEPELEKMLPQIKAWFSGQRGPWLFVFDGADEIDDEEDQNNVRIAMLVPPARSVHAIVTSRYSRMAKLSKFAGIEVGGLEPEQALRLFYASSELDEGHMYPESQKVAEMIVDEMERLALAVELAGSAVQKVESYKEDLKQYLEDFRSNKSELLVSEPEAVSQYGKSILAAWETTYRQLSRISFLAANLLGFLSVLDRTSITIDIFKRALDAEGVVSDTQRRKHPWWSTLAVDSELSWKAIEVAFQALRSFSLLEYNQASRVYTMHKLVHDWGYSRLDSDQKMGTCLANMDFIVKIISSGTKDVAERATILLHAVVSFTTCVTVYSSMPDTEQFDMLHQLQWYTLLSDQLGRWNETYRVEKFRFDELRRKYGEEDSYTISAMNELAGTLYEQGHLDEAARIQQEVLEKRKRLLGKDHPDTIIAIGNLAITLHKQGYLNKAARIQKEVLEKQKRTLGEDHPDTIGAIGNLASTLHKQGYLNEAARIQKEVLEKRKLILGEDHPDTISAMNSLAITLCKQGYLDEAVRIEKDVLEKRRRVLGEHHPDTIGAIENLAITLGDQGYLDEAVTMKKQVLEKRKRILGEHHPDTITAMYNLANTWADQGYIQSSIELFDIALEKAERVLGKEHLRTLQIRRNRGIAEEMANAP